MTMSYANRAFGHSHISWLIEGCCLWYLPIRKEIESPFFFVDCGVKTKWRMVVKCSNNEQDVWFQVTRLKHGDNRPIWAHLRLSHFIGKKDRPIFERQMLFNPGDIAEKEHKTWNDMSNDLIDVRLKLIVYVPNLIIDSECEDLYLRQLSRDMKKVYEKQKFCPEGFVLIETNTVTFYADKDILLQRIKNEIYRTMVGERKITMTDRYMYDDVDKVFSFLYTANMAPAVAYPQIGTYELAEEFGVQPLITYYQPDKLFMYSATKQHVFKITWTIAGLASRREQCLISPMINGELYHSFIKIIPDFNNTKGGNIGVNYIIYLAAEMHVCVELSLNTETYTEWLIEGRHKTFRGQESFGSDKIITAENLKIIPADGSVTLELKVRLSESIDDSSLGKSVTICKPYCHQQNYIELSKDMLCLYDKIKLKPLGFDLDRKIQKVLSFKYLLETRNHDFVNTFLPKVMGRRIDILNEIKLETLDQVIQFLFSGKFSKDLDYKDVFYFYKVATSCKFDSLKNALVDELKKQLSGQNVKDVYNFAMEFKIDHLVACIREHFTYFPMSKSKEGTFENVE